MNICELKSKIENNMSIPSDSYSLNGGLPNEALCLEYSYGVWSIYYSEKGNRSGKTNYFDESEACDQFYVLLKRMLQLDS